MLRKTSYIIWREINFIFKKRKLMAFYCLVFPFIIFFFILSIFFNKVIVEVPVAVVDHDRTSLSAELLRTIDATPQINITHYAASEKEAKEFLDAVKVFAVIVIDKDYEKNILKGRGGKVSSFVNNQYLMVGSSVYKGMVSVTETLSYKYKNKTYVSSGIPMYAVSSSALPLSVSENILYNPQMNYIYFLVLGLISAIIQLFVSVTIVYSLLTELKTRRAKEIKNIINQNPLRIVNAKLAVYVVLYTIVIMTMLFVLFTFFDVPQRGSLLVIFAGAVSFIMLTCTVSVLIAGATGNLRLGLSTAALYSAPAFAYFGVSFPVQSMPVFGRIWAEFLPGTHFNRVLINEAVRGANTTGSLKDIGVMLVISLILLIIGSKLYSLWTNNEKEWGPKI